MAVSASLRLGSVQPRQEALPDRGAWALFAAILLFAAMATPFFLGRVYTADDLGEFHLPLRDFYARQLAAGEPFDWLPALYHGCYITGEGQLGGYHPLHLALYRWLPLGAAYDLELLLSYPWMFIGGWLFLRRRLRSNEAGCWGALALSCSGFSLLHFVHPNGVAVLAHLPWLLWATETALLSSCARGAAAALAGVSLLTGSQILLGYPQYVWLSALAELAFALWLVRSRISAETLPRLGAAKAVGLLIGCIQLAPTLAAFGQSTRADADADFLSNGSLHPLNLLQLCAPYLFTTRVVGQNTHELGLYSGAVPLVLVVWLLANRRIWSDRRGWLVGLLVFAVLSLLMAMGEYGGLHAVQRHVPGVNAFRFPCRALALFQFALAALAATALGILREAPPAGPVRVWPLSLLAAAIALVGYSRWPEHCSPLWLAALGPLLMATAGWLVRQVQRDRPWAFAALAMFTAIDLGAYGCSYAVWRQTEDLNQFAASANAPKNGARIATLDNPESGRRVGNRALLRGVSRVDGYAGLEPRHAWPSQLPLVQQLAGAEFAEEPDGWRSVAAPAARVRLVTRTTTFDHESPSDWAPWPELLENLAIVESSLGLDGQPTGTATLVTDRPGLFEVQLVAASRQLLVTTESYHSGWQAVIDGQETPVVRVNRDFLGVVVPAGSQRLQLTFAPESRRWGLSLSACGLGLMACRWLAGSLPQRASNRRCVAPRRAPLATEGTRS